MPPATPPSPPPRPDATPTKLEQAQAACVRLEAHLRCAACTRPYGRERPWRSRGCEHSFCTRCAHTRGPACPVRCCAVPLRPADVVEDVGLRAVLDASRALLAWARPSVAPVRAAGVAAGQGVLKAQGRRAEGGVGGAGKDARRLLEVRRKVKVSSDDFLNQDLQLGAPLAVHSTFM